jgi:hypothetical protein
VEFDLAFAANSGVLGLGFNESHIIHFHFLQQLLFGSSPADRRVLLTYFTKWPTQNQHQQNHLHQLSSKTPLNLPPMALSPPQTLRQKSRLAAMAQSRKLRRPRSSNVNADLRDRSKILRHSRPSRHPKLARSSISGTTSGLVAIERTLSVASIKPKAAARGLCPKGSECEYLHRLPNSRIGKEGDGGLGDMFPSNVDCFGRDKFSDYRDDMGGVGSFMRVNRTLYVGRIHVTDDIEEVVARHFQECGQVERT